MITAFRQVLVLAPHTDDGELGAGGTIAKLIDHGSEVYYAAYSTAEQSVPAGLPKDILKTEVKRATDKLGIKESNLYLFNYEVRKLNYVRQEILETLIDLRAKIQPDLVLLPSLKDIHQDHATVATEGLRAFKNTTVLGYELIWNNLAFDTDVFVTLSEDDLNKKVSSLREYQSQHGRAYMSDDFITSLAKVRGVQIGCGFAECFELIRLVIK